MNRLGWAISGSDVYRRDGATWIDVAPAPNVIGSGSARAIASDGRDVFVATGTAVYRYAP
jgi:hypothetical protein